MIVVQRTVRDDGGRAAAGFAGRTGDCVTRAVAIASERPYAEVFKELSEGCLTQRKTCRSTKKEDASKGINVGRKWFKDYMTNQGFQWTPTMSIGSGCRVHLRREELPAGRLVVSVSRHYVAVIDGTIRDNFDPSRGGRRCVYGYWKMMEKTA